jgi:hypothetical protein
MSLTDKRQVQRSCTIVDIGEDALRAFLYAIFRDNFDSPHDTQVYIKTNDSGYMVLAEKEDFPDDGQQWARIQLTDAPIYVQAWLENIPPRERSKYNSSVPMDQSRATNNDGFRLDYGPLELGGPLVAVIVPAWV